MIRYFCDRCGKEVDQLNGFKIPCHIVEKTNGIGYVDKDFNEVSGRFVDYGLCNKCFNLVMEAAFHQLQWEDHA